ncbi:MAG: phosphatase PAP2 family protein [Planctomycetaceae bacterium]|jgi:hypothetical protein
MKPTTDSSFSSSGPCRPGFWSALREGVQHLLGFACLMTPLALPLSPPEAQADEITYWNGVMLDAIRGGSTPPPRASRGLAMMHTAMFDAVNSVGKNYRPYEASFVTSSTASREAAAAQAAHDVLVSLYPSLQGTFDTKLTNRLNLITNGADKTDGITLGQSSAQSILALRLNDKANLVVPYTPGTDPGDWRPTPAGFASGLLPNWPQVTPWAISSGSAYRDPIGPPPLTSAAYAAAFNEVKDLGAQNSATRTADQTNIAKFWADGAGTATPPGHWNLIATGISQTEGLDIEENARLFAQLNIAMADAAIICWDQKYATEFWRPVTAIRAADTDGNSNTTQDTSWTPLLATPPFPSYTSGHSTFSGAASTILEEWFGANYGFTTSAEGFIVPNRSFASFAAAADEAGLSRIYGGIHFSFDNVNGLAAGRTLGAFVFSTQLQAVPEPSTLVLFAGAIAALAYTRRRNCRRDQ